MWLHAFVIWCGVVAGKSLLDIFTVFSFVFTNLFTISMAKFRCKSGTCMSLSLLPWAVISKSSVGNFSVTGGRIPGAPCSFPYINGFRWTFSGNREPNATCYRRKPHCREPQPTMAYCLVKQPVPSLDQWYQSTFTRRRFVKWIATKPYR